MKEGGTVVFFFFLFFLFSIEWLLHKKKITYASVVFGMFVWFFFCLFFFKSQDKLRVSAVNRVVEETISIGMPIPRRKVKGKGSGGRKGRKEERG